jgi:LruC domain-containing protein
MCYFNVELDMKKIFILTFILLSMIIVSSCQDNNLFDQTVYDSILKQSFPVDSIDPNQDWKTVGNADVSVYVNLDYGETYTVKIYKSNPLAYEIDTLLASGTVTSGETLNITMSYPLVQDMFYVTLVDKDGYMQVKPTSLENGKLTAYFGESSSTSAKTRYNTPKKADAYTIPIYSSPTVSQYLDGAEELNSTNATSWGATKTLKLTGNWTSTINNLGNWNDASRTLYITGTWTLPNNISQSLGNNGVIVVADGGSINIPKNSTLSVANGGKIYVMSGGTISGNGTLYFDGSGTTGYDYNAGTINISTFNVHGSSFYNVGSITTLAYQNQSSGYPFINWGRLIVNGDMSTYNCPFYNGCYVKCSGAIIVTDLKIGSSAYVYSNSLSLNSSQVVFNNNGILDTNILSIGNSSIYGPTSGDDAVFQFANISNLWGTNYLYNNLDICTTRNSWNLISFSSPWANFYGNSAVKSYLWSQINKTYDSSECSDGISKDNPTPVTDTTLGYTFCYEDNYPAPGDYDFNDVVISVFPSTNNNKMTLKVILDAVGASKQSAGAIRLAGIKASDIISITKSGNTKEESTGLNTTFISRTYITDIQSNLLTGRASVGNDIVIPVFNDAHYAISGSMFRYFYNTVVGGKTAVPDTVTYTITFKDAATASKLVVDSLDAFILYDYNSAKWEVHTYPFKGCKVLYDRNEANSSTYPWAVVVPKPFYYPVEYQPITVKITDSNATDTGAYSMTDHSFAGWAADKSTNQDWYKYPVTTKVYGYPSSSSSAKKRIVKNE